MDLAQLLETMRVKAGQTALAAAVVIDGKIKAVAAVGTRKHGTKNWVTVDDRSKDRSVGGKRGADTVSGAIAGQRPLPYGVPQRALAG